MLHATHPGSARALARALESSLLEGGAVTGVTSEPSRVVSGGVGGVTSEPSRVLIERLRRGARLDDDLPERSWLLVPALALLIKWVWLGPLAIRLEALRGTVRLVVIACIWLRSGPEVMGRVAAGLGAEIRTAPARRPEALAGLGRVHAPEEGCKQWPSTALRGARRAWEGARTSRCLACSPGQSRTIKGT